MSCRGAVWRQMRKISLAGRNLAGLLDPIFAERSLQPIDDRTNDAQTGVAPVMAIVHAPEVAEAERVKHADLCAGVAQLFLETLFHFVTAGGIDEEPHFDT